jgi:hypothetical protein
MLGKKGSSLVGPRGWACLAAIWTGQWHRRARCLLGGDAGSR